MATIKTRNPLVADAWNAHNAPDHVLEAIILDWLSEGGDWLSLNEVWTKRPTLQRLAKKHNLYLFHEVPGNRTGAVIEEAGSTAVLLNRESVKVGVTRVFAHQLKWFVYSARRWHTGRRDPMIRFKLKADQQKFAGRAIHFPTNGHTGGNSEAFYEHLRSVSEFFRGTQPGVVKFAIGDGNDSVSFFRTWADWFDGRVDGHGPDLCVVKNAALKVRVLAKSGSDHHRIRAIIG